MSELQIAMIGFGALLVGAVFAYNYWQDRKYRRLAEKVLPTQRKASNDVLMAGRKSLEEETRAVRAAQADRSGPGFMEPHIGNSDQSPQEPSLNPTAAPEVLPSQSDHAPSPRIHAAETSCSPPVPSEWADGQADCLMLIEFPDAVSVAALWAEQSEWASRIDKSMQWLVVDDQTGRWRTFLPQDAFPVTHVAAALQLADRKGPVSETTLGTFVAGVHQIAQRYSGLVEMPDQSAVLRRAEALDDFCAGVDLQLSLHVIARQGSLNALVGAKLKPEIDAAGLTLEGERFVAVDASGAEVFALSCQGSTAFAPDQLETASLTALILSIDVPRVAHGAVGFDRMIAVGRRCAEALGGQLVDAHKKPLALATLAAIRQRIEEIQGQMDTRAIPAGGVRALRLFS